MFLCQAKQGPCRTTGYPSPFYRDPKPLPFLGAERGGFSELNLTAKASGKVI